MFHGIHHPGYQIYYILLYEYGIPVEWFLLCLMFDLKYRIRLLRIV